MGYGSCFAKRDLFNSSPQKWLINNYANILENIIFRQDNAPADEGVLEMRTLRDFKYELLEYPYSPDLAPLT